MRETEEKLTELQGQYHALTQSYQTLQHEYSAVKEELENLRSQNERGSPIRRNLPSCLREWDESVVEGADPLMFDTSVFRYNVEGDRT
jgi:AP-1-like factor